MEKKITPSFKESLKSWDTENILDRYFYRPLGYKIAVLLNGTGVTPNLVTIISIFVGVYGCILFYPNDLYLNLLGFLILVFANILDCVDGQLARISGIKSEIGRILDGFCGDIWFLTFYTVMALRMMTYDHWGLWSIAIVAVSALSHLYQAGMVDYYKTLHLHFLKNGQNSEFGFSDSIKEKLNQLEWKKNPDKKFFLKLYYLYTLQQERSTPQLAAYVKHLNEIEPNGYSEQTVLQFRSKSLKMMPLLDSMTFNTRSLVMILSLVLQLEWVYFVFEIILLNILLWISVGRHEKMCKLLNH